MFSRLNFLGFSLLLFLVTGCGQLTTQKTPMTPTAPYNAVGKGTTVVILPFVDYADSTIDTARRRNLLINEALTDTLSLNGFTLPVQEDVIAYLKANGIAKPTKTSALQRDLVEGDWSAEMKQVLQKEISEQDTQAGIERQQLANIGKYFHAEYVMRGRIIEYKKRTDEGWRFWEKGILPFLGEGASRLLFGFVDVSSEDGHSESVFSNGKRATGMVEMRIWVQDVNTGDVVWTNHNSIEAARASAFADPQHDVLFKRAVERSACILVHDFAKSGL